MLKKTIIRQKSSFEKLHPPSATCLLTCFRWCAQIFTAIGAYNSHWISTRITFKIELNKSMFIQFSNVSKSTIDKSVGKLNLSYSNDVYVECFFFYSHSRTLHLLRSILTIGRYKTMRICWYLKSVESHHLHSQIYRTKQENTSPPQPYLTWRYGFFSLERNQCCVVCHNSYVLMYCTPTPHSSLRKITLFTR